MNVMPSRMRRARRLAGRAGTQEGAVEPSEEAGSPDRAGQLRERAVLVVLSAVQFTSIVDFMVIMPLGPQLMRKLGINPQQFGLVVSSYTFAAGLSGLVASSLVDRFGRKAAFLSLYSGFLVGTLLCGLAPSYGALAGARLATGTFGGILGGMAMAIVGDLFPDARRGRATGALMSAFALASIAGVPLGLYIGTRWGWHVPFLILAVLGCPVLAIAAVVLPPLKDHLGQAASLHPLRSLAETFRHPNHLKAFALITVLMLGGFAISPFMPTYLVSNVGMSEEQLPWVFVAGGAVTLFSAPWIGRMADRYGKLLVFRLIAPISAALSLAVTMLPDVSVVLAVATVASLIVVNSGRMVPAMAMITGSVAPERRGGFMSANSSVQHLAAGLGSYIAGLIIAESSDGRLENFALVGCFAAVTTLVSLWLAGRLRPAEVETITTTELSLAAASEASCDAGEPLVEAE